MRKLSLVASLVALCGIITMMMPSCQQPASEKKAESFASTEKSVDSSTMYGGYASAAKWGEHLVLTSGCHDCHTPKKFGPQGMELDMSKALSGHPAELPVPDVNRKENEKKGLMTSNDLTVWVGPWGVSFAANLTPDGTGTGAWKEEQFLYAIRNGIYKGLPGSRPLLPPMPWQMIQNMTDNELKAIFAYLRTVTPVKNVVPAPLPPAMAAK